MDFDKIQEVYKKEAEDKELTAKEEELLERHQELILSNRDIRSAIMDAAIINKKNLRKHAKALSSVEVKNMPDMEAIAKGLSVKVSNFPNFPDMSKNLEGIRKEVKVLSNKYTDVDFKPVTDVLNKVLKEVGQLPKEIKVPKDKDVAKALKEVAAKIDKIDIKPEVKVDVKKPDLSGIKKSIDGLSKKLEQEVKEPEMTDYLPQQQDSETEGYQYFGFVHPTGRWFIMANDLDEEEFGYVFGIEGYKDAWINRHNLTYGYIDEVQV
jgi:DNA mismatch repair ATPase MutS